MKNPEAYLEESVVPPDQERDSPGSSSLEEDFLARYFSGAAGGGPVQCPEPVEDVQTALPVEPRTTEVLDPPAPKLQIVQPGQDIVQEQAGDRCAQEEGAASEDQTQFVGFFLQGQEHAVPIGDVQEVIKRIEPTRLPLSPDYVSGVINLRGKVTPLVDVARLMGKSGATGAREFIIVCRHGDLQLGLEVERISTMYHVRQDMIEWSLDGHLEDQDGMISGLIKDQTLIGILDVRALAEAVVQAS
jgi:purine-binding chemotaxis protein CheW